MTPVNLFADAGVLTVAYSPAGAEHIDSPVAGSPPLLRPGPPIDNSASAIAESMTAAVDALLAVPRDLAAYRALDDVAVLALTRAAAEEVRLAQLHVALLAGEIAHRSAPELGHLGLAQRSGHRTPDELVRVTTGTRVADARAAVRVGRALGGLDSPTGVASPADTGGGSDMGTSVNGDNGAKSILASAVLEGRISVAVADAIGIGIGVATLDVTTDVIEGAIEQLLPRIEGLDADRAGREARAARDDIDLDGIPAREEAQRARRSLRLGRRSDGMGYAYWILDPETFALVSDVFDRATSPQRRTPSFMNGDSEAGAGAGASHRAHQGAVTTLRAIDDPRTVEQRASDTFVELLRHGVAADTAELLGDAPIGVRMIVAARAVHERRGRGYIEGHPDAVSLASIERQACSAGTITLTVDGSATNAGQPLNLGRERRLFSRAQRLALAARDGGCRWPGCDRPPSWCEAHHINHWQRDHGRTDVADGILLCRHHHLLSHNNGWEITRAGPHYALTPPDAKPGEAITMPSSSRALEDALRE
jgi:hypothetical protein